MAEGISPTFAPRCCGAGGSSAGGSKACDDNANKPNKKQATHTTPHAAANADESEETKPEKAAVKAKKIPVARKLKAAAAPPDPCKYTASKGDDGEDEMPAKKVNKAVGKKSKSDNLKLPAAKSAYFIFSAEQRGPLKSTHPSEVPLQLHRSGRVACGWQYLRSLSSLLQVRMQNSLLPNSTRSSVRP